MASDKKGELTPASAIEFIKPFFEGSWSSVDSKNVQIEKLKGGMCNSIYKVTRIGVTQVGVSGDEPASLIIKIKGGNVIDADQFPANNTYNAIAIVTYEMSKR